MIAMQTRRSGFTLIEILVVVAIIVVLATLAISATYQLIGGQRQSNTESTVQTTFRALDKAWQKVVADSRKETPSSAVLSWAGSQDLAQVIWVKLRLMEAFPTSYDEIFTTIPTNLYNTNYIPSGMRKNIATYQQILTKRGITSSKATFPNSESSACLLMSLGMGRGGGASNADILGSNVTDSDGDGMPEIVDGWGTPLFFFRFPTPSNWPKMGANNLSALQGSSPNPTAQFPDPIDPFGTLMNTSWSGTATFTSNVHSIAYDTSHAYYVIPVVVSAGPNGMYTPGSSSKTIQGLGLVQGTMDLKNTANTADSDDNIYSFQLRMGATGN